MHHGRQLCVVCRPVFAEVWCYGVRMQVRGGCLVVKAGMDATDAAVVDVTWGEGDITPTVGVTCTTHLPGVCMHSSFRASLCLVLCGRDTIETCVSLAGRWQPSRHVCLVV